MEAPFFSYYLEPTSPRASRAFLRVIVGSLNSREITLFFLQQLFFTLASRLVEFFFLAKNFGLWLNCFEEISTIFYTLLKVCFLKCI